MSTRASVYKINRPAIDALIEAGKQITGIDPKLKALVELRASQINGCGYCIDMHSVQAREHGETQQRLDCLVAWRECDFFTEAEQAAFRWAEALTDISRCHAPDALYEALKPHYSEQQIVDLTLTVAVINAWNRIAIGHGAHPPKRNAPASQG